MPRDFSKLQILLEKELNNGLALGTFKYSENSPMFERIFNEYNKDVPSCWKFQNTVKNRKLVCTRLERLLKKPTLRNETVLSNCSNLSKVMKELNDFESTQISEILQQDVLEELNVFQGDDILSEIFIDNQSEKVAITNHRNGNRLLNEKEFCALQALLVLCEPFVNHTLMKPSGINACQTTEVVKNLHTYLTEDEICALDALCNMYEESEVLQDLYEKKENSHEESIERIVTYLKGEINNSHDSFDVSNAMINEGHSLKNANSTEKISTNEDKILSGIREVLEKISTNEDKILSGIRDVLDEFRKGYQDMVLPRGVSGDVYNLSDCILQQALIGSTANPLVLNYLKHSLCAHLISYSAVLRRISKYEYFERIYCITSLLDFLNTILDGVTCRTKSEETILPGAIVSLVNWLMQIFAMVTTNYEMNREISADQSYMLDQCCLVIEKLATNQFLLAILYVGRQEDLEYYSKIRENYATIKTSLTNSNFTPAHPEIEKYLQQLAYIDVHHLEMKTLDIKQLPEPIAYCVQPLLAVEVLLNPCNDASYYVAEMQMLQRLKKFSNTRLFYEIIRAGFVSLSNVVETSHDTMWGAFTFFKVPQIIKQLHALNRAPGDQNPTDYIPEVVKALEMLLEDNLLLDFMDSKCSCNIIEYLLNDWTKQHLVNDAHVKHFAAQREEVSMLLQKREAGNTPSIINFIIRAEVPLSGILKTLSTDYNKVQEALLGVLCQVLVGNSFDLILSVATVEGRLKTFVSRLIQCNENSKQIPGEVGKTSIIRSTLFDVSFLILTSIVQTYGSDTLLSENGDSFFEKWVRICMVERNRPKNYHSIIALCDENIVDELLLSFSKPETQLKNSNITWQDICLNLPGVLYHVLVAWEKETLSSADVKNILDNIKRRMFSFSVCAASFLCAFMHSAKKDELLKPLNMIQQFLSPPGNEELSSQENFKERLGLSLQIIRKMQYDVHPTCNLKSRGLTLTQNLVSRNPLIEQFKEVWNTVVEHGWVPVRAVQVIESLLHAGGASWLATRLVEEMLKCKYKTDMIKTMDIIFAILHLDIERTTEALLTNVVPSFIHNRQGDDINEPQSYILARLCVYCIISALEARSQNSTSQKKRTRSNDGDDHDITNAAKMRKITADGSDNSCSNDYLSENSLLLSSSLHSNSLRETPAHLKESLQSAMQYVFKIFQQFVTTDELSPKIYFVYQFITLLVECGKERVRPVLKLLPPNLINNLIKVMLTDDINVGLITRLYDLRVNTGRQTAVSDLCLWRNIKLKQQSIQL